LRILLENPGETVSREELRGKIWGPDTFVDFDHSLATAIQKVRDVLGDSASNPRFVETVPRRGYRFIAPVEMFPKGGFLRQRSPGTVGSRKWGQGILLIVSLVIAAAVIVFVLDGKMEPEVRYQVSPLTSYPGTEVCPSFSPSGNQLAFAWNQENQWDIYVKSIGPGEPLRLTADPRPDWDPAWSPDGSLIAFLRAGEGVLIVPALGGTERRLRKIRFPGSGPQFGFLAWSPDGRWLVVADGDMSKNEPYGLFLLSVETAKMHRLTTPPQGVVGDFFADFSPDGSRLAFVRVGVRARYIYVQALTSDFLAQGEPQRITSHGGAKVGLTWSANSEEIIFSDGSRLYRVAASGTDEPEPLPIFAEGLFNPRMSRVGHRLACAQWPSSKADIWRIDLIGSEQETTSPIRFISSTRVDTQPQYSPDGSRVVFYSERNGAGGIWICDADGSHSQQVIAAEGARATWSPDGARISFELQSNGGNPDICVIESNGTDLRRVTTDPAEDSWPSWSKDGQWIYFESNRGGVWQIWKVPVKGGDAEQVTQAGGRFPQVSPGGQLLYYVHHGEDLWKVGLDDGDPIQVPDVKTWGAYSVRDEGIYYVPPLNSDDRFEILYFDTVRGEIKRIAAFDQPFGWGFTVSPDGRTILYAQAEEQGGADLLLVENFR
jgi:Tol biopolymer transport system component